MQTIIIGTKGNKTKSIRLDVLGAVPRKISDINGLFLFTASLHPTPVKDTAEIMHEIVVPVKVKIIQNGETLVSSFLIKVYTSLTGA